MLRLVLLVLMLVGLVSGLSHGWIVIRWDRLARDAHLPQLGNAEGIPALRPSRP